jgi:hypothetical protein
MGLILKQYQSRTFIPYFVLLMFWDNCLQSAGGPSGPPKWEFRSRMGVYLEHSPFHAGSVALVFNPKTARVSSQYHVIFDYDFTTVPYIEQGKVPPNWEEFSCLSTTLPQKNLRNWLSSGCWDKKSMPTRMDILFQFRIESPTLSVSCLISAVLSGITYSQKLTKTLAIPSVQLPRERANTYHLLSHLARLLQQGPCHQCHNWKGLASDST